MKQNIWILFCIIITIMPAGAKSVKIDIKTANGCTLRDQPVVLNLEDYNTQFDKNERNQLAVFVNGKQVSSQLDDLNSDGIADELVFFPVNEGDTDKITAVLKPIADKKRATFPKEVYAEMLLKQPDGSVKYVTEASSVKNDMYNKMHHHGVAWESTLVAYRIYFDNKSTIDVYDKKKPQLELEACQWYPNDEQLAQGFGDDVLLVSGSVGVGTIKGWNGKKAVHIDKFAKRTQRIVSQGNLRTICETEVEGWQYEGKTINMTVRYIQYARQRDCVVEVRADQDIDALATGVQKVKDGGLFTDPENGLLGSFGTDWPVNDTIKYAKETVGLGVLVDKDMPGLRYVQDKVNNLVLMPYKKGTVLRFRMTAVSSKDAPWTQTAFFDDFLQAWLQEQRCKPVITQK